MNRIMINQLLQFHEPPSIQAVLHKIEHPYPQTKLLDQLAQSPHLYNQAKHPSSTNLGNNHKGLPIFHLDNSPANDASLRQGYS